MTTPISFSPTSIEEKAFSTIALDPQGWAENAYRARAEQAIQDIIIKHVARCRQEGWPIPPTDEAIVDDAFERGTVQTVEEANAAFNEARAALLNESEPAPLVDGLRLQNEQGEISVLSVDNDGNLHVAPETA